MKKVWGFIKWLFKTILGFFIKNKKALGVAAAIVGGGGAAAGIGGLIYGNRVNKKARATLDSAVARYNEIKAQTEGVLEELGDTEMSLVETYDTFNNKLDVKAEESGLKFNKVYNTKQEKAMAFLVNELRLGRVYHDNIGVKKTDYYEFKYCICSSRSNDSIRGEVFTINAGDRYVVVVYRHGDFAKHAQEVALFLGSISVSAD